MLNNNVVMVSITAILLLGFLVYDYGISLDDEESLDPLTKYYENEYWMDSFQYNNMAWSGHSNQTNLTFNNTGELFINGSVQCYFEDLGELRGYLNISLYINDTLLKNYYFQEYGEFNYTGHLSTNNITIVLQSVGSDSDPFSDFADYYVFEIDADVVFEG
ncbi:hypothetical protein CL614_02555 [archaeon]|nr:hypothetical protein [archaeon]|tara:strand:+ start:2275 stop:2757 length:483 start_codon:yes stop_codon:yes gene_type:complete